MATFADYKIAIRQAQQEHPQWRLGQAAFNVLYEMRPDLSEHVRATTLDPFHRRTNEECAEFFNWVEMIWSR